MLSVIAIWVYMLLTTFLAGYGISRAVAHYIPYRIRHLDACLICGFAAVTVYAQIFSLFGGVGLAANLLLCVLCAFAAWRCRQELGLMLRETWGNIWSGQPGERGKVFAILFLFLLFAYGTSRGIIHYDTGLYHAQSIRWIEEYGVVKGLGNLHCRLAYNSASFALSALYSMAFLGGQSFHCCAGFLALILACVCLKVIDSLRRRVLRTSDFARVMGIYYLVIIFDEMVSPASDYFMVLTAFYIIIRWLDLLEEGVRETAPYGLLCVLGVFLMTVKLSAALILLLVIYPAYDLLKKKRWQEIGIYLLLGITTALPYFIRNFLLSGWLVYPFTQIDLFRVAWKIPKGMADYDAKEIQVWGRGYTDVTRYDISMSEWMPDWFHALPGSDRVLVAAAVMSIGILFVYGIGMLCGFWRRRMDILLVQTAVSGSFLFWLCTSPMIRYGCVYVYLVPAVVLGGVYDAIVNDGECNEQTGEMVKRGWKRIIKLCGAVAVSLVLLYKAAALGKEIIHSYVNDYWVLQKDYENYETLSYEASDITFYYPVQGDQTGYEAFPSAPTKTEAVLMGTELEDGFMAGNNE